MSVNGILEGYLTIYGWQVYASIFMPVSYTHLDVYKRQAQRT